MNNKFSDNIDDILSKELIIIPNDDNVDTNIEIPLQAYFRIILECPECHCGMLECENGNFVACANSSCKYFQDKVVFHKPKLSIDLYVADTTEYGYDIEKEFFRRWENE